jgi:hypothetical protein
MEHHCSFALGCALLGKQTGLAGYIVMVNRREVILDKLPLSTLWTMA